MKWNILHKPKTGNKQTTPEEIISLLLQNRGLNREADIQNFLHPSLDVLTIENVGLSSRELEKAAQRIKKAIETKEPIVVYTDYDVDGISAGAIVWETLHGLGARVMPYVPHRELEGYGLSTIGIDKIKKDYNASLLITVDHGITAQEKIAYARKQKIETIVLDHHLLPDILPEVVALVHTTMLSSGGIAFLFGQFLHRFFAPSKDAGQTHLELAALATIADLIPLTGPNRVITKFGLSQLNKTRRIGLQALRDISGLGQQEIDVYHVSHMLAPRINALGRLTHALDALRLFCTKDWQRAKQLAESMNTINRERQLVTEESVMHALAYVRQNGNGKGKLLFLHHPSYKQGVIGLIAGKLTQTYYMPAIVISEGVDYSKASARSIPGFNIVEIIRRASDLLVDVGGHPMAAGFTVETKNIIRLKEKLQEITDRELADELLVQSIHIDMEIDLDAISTELYNAVCMLSPFGIGNPQPTFMTRNVHVVNAALVGKEKNHLKLTIHKGNTRQTVSAIGFGLGDMYPNLSSTHPIDIAYTLDENIWNGTRSLQLKLKDVRITDRTSRKGG